MATQVTGDGGAGRRGFSTRQLHERAAGAAPTARATPIYLTAGFEFDEYEQAAAHFGEGRGYAYTRIGNPTVEAVEHTLAALEGGSQALLLSSYPRALAGLAMAMWSMTTLIAPVTGPLLGGWITDNMAWPWIFYINVPVGIASVVVTWGIFHKRETVRRALPIDFDAAPFQHQAAFQHGHAGASGNKRGHPCIVVAVLLFAPAIEIEVHAGQRAARLFHEDGARIAHPQVVDGLHQQLDLVAAQASGCVVIFLVDEHVHGFDAGDRLRDARQVRLRARLQALAPDVVIRAESHPRGRVALAFVGHAPAGSSRQHGQGW